MIRHGVHPFLECSSRGDKRFSAFYARIRARGNKSIEALYQAAKVFRDGATGLPIDEAKGLRPVNDEEVRALYSTLWDEYIAENPDLVQVLVQATGLSDVYGKRGSVCQATELWRIRCAALGEEPGLVNKSANEIWLEGASGNKNNPYPKGSQEYRIYESGLSNYRVRRDYGRLDPSRGRKAL